MGWAAEGKNVTTIEQLDNDAVAPVGVTFTTTAIGGSGFEQILLAGESIAVWIRVVVAPHNPASTSDSGVILSFDYAAI